MTTANPARIPPVAPKARARPAPKPKRPRPPLLMSDVYTAHRGRPTLLDLMPVRPPKR